MYSARWTEASGQLAGLSCKTTLWGQENPLRWRWRRWQQQQQQEQEEEVKTNSECLSWEESIPGTTEQDGCVSFRGGGGRPNSAIKKCD